jgi:hypothetical protein
MKQRGRKSSAELSIVAALAAFLLLHLCGPEARANSQLNSAAQSRDQPIFLESKRPFLLFHYLDTKVKMKVYRWSYDHDPVVV